MTDLAERLDRFDSGSIHAMHTLWLGKSIGGKASQISALTAVLGDEPAVVTAIAAWPIELRTALAAVARAGGGDAPRLAAHVIAAGVSEGFRSVGRLAERGLLLPDPRAPGNKIDASRLAETGSGPLTPLPVLARLLPVPTPGLFLAEVPDAKVREQPGVDPGVLASAVSGLLGLAHRRRLRLNADGLPGLPLLGTLTRELGDDALFAFMVALAGGALVPHSGELLPQPGNSLHTSPEGLLRGLLDGFLARGTWRDDAPPGRQADLLAWLRETRGQQAHAGDAALLRIVLAGALRRLSTSGWVRVDDLIEHVLGLDDSLFWLARDAGWHRSRRRGPSTASDRRERRTLCAAVLVRTFAAFGVVAVGSLSRGAALPVFMGHSRVLDDAHRVESSYLAAERLKPMWKPEPTPWVVKVTPMGRRLLDPSAPAPPRAAPTASQGLHVGADFEIVAHRHQTDAGLAFQLDGAAIALPAGPADPVRRWRLDRDRWLSALSSGFDGEGFLQTLTAACGRPIPSNVLATLEGWGRQFGTISLLVGFDLLEFDGEGPTGERSVTVPGWALVKERAVPGTVVNYPAGDGRCLEVEDAMTLTATAGKGDLLLPGELSTFADRAGPRKWRLARQKVEAVGAATTLTTLARRMRAPLPPAMSFRIRAWCGEERVRVAGAELLQAPDARAVAELPELAPFILGVLTDTLLVIRPGKKALLLRSLAELGIVADTTLQFRA